MLFLSYNMRGIGGTSKLTTICRLIEIKSPKIIAFQETMTDEKRVKELMMVFLKEWKMETIDVDGHSGGLIKSWSPDIIFHSKSEYKDTLRTELEDPETGIRFFLSKCIWPIL